MPKPPQEVDSRSWPRRSRTNTTFGPFAWRRNRVPNAEPVGNPSPTVEALLAALTPPAALSVDHAHALAAILRTRTPPPAPASLMPVLAVLCAPHTPTPLQAVGFDILSTYCICCAESGTLTTGDRLGYVDLFRTQAGVWAQDVWEPRLRALVALTDGPAGEVMGVDRHIRDILIAWICGAFDGMLAHSPAEWQERERAVQTVSEHLTNWACRPETAARLSEVDVVSLFNFFAGLVDRALQVSITFAQASTPPATPLGQSTEHDLRYHSPITPPYVLYRPLQVAAHVYLMHLATHLSALPLSYLPTLLSLLFRLLAACMSPLPDLSRPLTPRSAQFDESQDLHPVHDLEARVNKAISALLIGPYSTTCRVLLKRHLLPLASPSLPSSTTPSSSAVPDISHNLVASTSLGAHRTLRLHVRHSIFSMVIDEREPHHEGGRAGHAVGVWDARKVSYLLEQAVCAWIAWDGTKHIDGVRVKEAVLEEVAGVLNDTFQVMDNRLEGDADTAEDAAQQVEETDDEYGHAVGAILYELAQIVRGMNNPDDSPVLLPLSSPLSAPTSLLRTISALLARSPTRPAFSPPLPLTLLAIAPHLSDADTARIPGTLVEMRLLGPASPDWLGTWVTLLSEPALLQAGRSATRRALYAVLGEVHRSLRDMPGYRRPLAALAFSFWMTMLREGRGDAEAGGSVDGIRMWRILGDEVVLRACEDDTEVKDVQRDPTGLESPLSIDAIVNAMANVAARANVTQTFENADAVDASAKMSQVPLDMNEDTNITSTVPSASTSATHRPSSSNSPIRSRPSTHRRDRDSGVPTQLLSLLSFATGGGSRSQAQSQAQAQATLPPEEPSQSTILPTSTVPDFELVPAALASTMALVDVFTQLAFSEQPVAVSHKGLVVAVFERLLTLLRTAQCARARLTVLQLLLRLRADRDHRIFFMSDPAARETSITTLARLIGRDSRIPVATARKEDTRASEGRVDEVRRARSMTVRGERGGRRASRGNQTPNPTPSRSHSRAPASKTAINTMPREPLWCLPDKVSLTIEHSDKISKILISFDPVGPEDGHILPVSCYLEALVEILRSEKDWEILSYVLVHLPVQLANKHLWCGPITHKVIPDLVADVCKGISEDSFGQHIPSDAWPARLKSRDARGLVYHTLVVLISYQSLLETKMRHALVEVFQAGLSDMPSTVESCLHALSLSAFELQSSLIRFLPRILEKLSQIMTNPTMAVHILAFLSIVGSLPTLYANFTENDYKMVFGVALQYLQHYNRPETLAGISFALSQHVRIMSYYLVYVWFLAVRLSDRPRHVKFISRQLLLANEDKMDIDEATEVCFDWLARYTYANVDPKPAPSLLSELVSNPAVKQPAEEASVQEKSWLLGHSIVTIRTLAKVGWIEVVSRRTSGITKFLCKTENVPLVGLGDVDPDMTTIPASLMMDGDPDMTRQITFPSSLSSPTDISLNQTGLNNITDLFNPSDTEVVLSRPDPITGYVWSGSAPSQRRKRVDLDPSFFALQLSAYPDVRRPGPPGRIITDKPGLTRMIRTLDRIPVIDTHKVGIMYVAPGQVSEVEILRNTHGSPAYTYFLERIGRLIKIHGQLDVYAGGLDPEEDGEYAYAWWDDIGQILYHTATLMPTYAHDERCNNKKRHIGNDYVRIVWNDSGLPYKFDTLTTQFQFINIVIEPHSHGAIAAYSNNLHENEYFKVTIQRAEQMVEFTPIGDFKIVSADSLSPLIRQLSLLADWYASVFEYTARDSQQTEFITNWRGRLQAIKRYADSLPELDEQPPLDPGIIGQEIYRDFTTVHAIEAPNFIITKAHKIVSVCMTVVWALRRCPCRKVSFTKWFSCCRRYLFQHGQLSISRMLPSE